MKIVIGVLAILATIILSSSADAAPPANNKWTLTFNDEFTGLTVNPRKWNTSYWWGANTIINNELQYYVDVLGEGTTESKGVNPFRVSNGMLTITANRAPNGCCNGQPFTSGALTTLDKFSQTYGYFEQRAKMPSGKGLWPAFWIENNDRQWPPEIDIYEMVGQRPTQLINTSHSNTTGTHTFEQCWPYYITPDMSKDFHIYGLEWTPTDLNFYFDNKLACHLPTQLDQNRPMYLLMNLAIGSTETGWTDTPDQNTPFPQTLKIDYVRVYEDPPSTPVSEPASLLMLSTGLISLLGFWRFSRDLGDQVPTRVRPNYNTVHFTSWIAVVKSIRVVGCGMRGRVLLR